MRRLLILCPTLILLASCEPNEFRVPALGGGGGGSGNSCIPGWSCPIARPAPAPAQGYKGQPLTPPAEMPIEYNEPGKVESHGATSPQACRLMEQKFLMQGRRIKLHRIRRTAIPGLRYECEFTGEDAQEGYFDDRRYGR